jgi:plasmid stabilization system protein ParE
MLALANEELREAAEYDEKQRPGLGDDFRAEVRSTLDRIVAMPESWKLVSPNTRRCRLNRFPSSVFFAIDADEIVVIAISHASRLPDHWRNRL